MNEDLLRWKQLEVDFYKPKPCEHDYQEESLVLEEPVGIITINKCTKCNEEQV